MRRLAISIWAVVVLMSSCADDQVAERTSSATDAGPVSTGATEPTPPPAPSASSSTSPPASTRVPPTTSQTATPPVPTVAPTASTEGRTVETDELPVGEIDVSFELPPGWERTGQAVATEFAVGADCASATIVDFEPPTDPAAGGEAGFRLQSIVQVCAQPLDGRTLDEFMDDTYGDRSAFDPVRIGGLDGYRSTTGHDSVSFVQSDTRRYQIVTGVAADPALEQERLDQVAAVEESLAFG